MSVSGKGLLDELDLRRLWEALSKHSEHTHKRASSKPSVMCLPFAWRPHDTLKLLPSSAQQDFLRGEVLELDEVSKIDAEYLQRARESSVALLDDAELLAYPPTWWAPGNNPAVNANKKRPALPLLPSTSAPFDVVQAAKRRQPPFPLPPA